jgi:hypothetical protein
MDTDRERNINGQGQCYKWTGTRIDGDTDRDRNTN